MVFLLMNAYRVISANLSTLLDEYLMLHEISSMQ